MTTLSTSSPSNPASPNSSPLPRTRNTQASRSAAGVAPRAYLVAILALVVAVGAIVLLRPSGALPTASPLDAAEAGVVVELAATPAHLMPGEPTQLTYTLTDAGTRAPVADIRFSHGRGFEVLVISTDLTDLRRITAHQAAAGVFHVSFTPSVDTQYLAYARFDRDGQQLQDLRRLVNHSGRIALPTLPFDVEAKVVGGLWIQLLMAAGRAE